MTRTYCPICGGPDGYIHDLITCEGMKRHLEELREAEKELDATLARVAIALNETWQHQPATALNEEEEPKE